MVTSIEELKKMRNTFEAELPPFADGSKLVVLLKKPSVFDMVLNGKISNPLFPAVNNVLGKSSENNSGSDTDYLESIKFIKEIAENCLVQPTAKEIKEYTGSDLTDEQIMAIYSLAVKDVNDLEKFCKVPANN